MSIIHNSDDYFPYHRHHSSSPQLQQPLQPQQQHQILTPAPTTMTTTQPFYEMYERIDHDIQVTTTSMTNNTHQPHSQHSHHYYNNNNNHTNNNNNNNNYSPPPHHHHHSLSQQQQQQQIYSSSPPLSSSSLRYVFVDTQKEREALEQENVRLMQHKNRIECHICELDDLIQLIQSKKMELQMEVEQMDRKQSQTVQELERVRMKIETNRKRKNHHHHHHSQQQSTNDAYNNHESLFHSVETMFSLHHNDRSRSNSSSSSSSSSGGGGDRSSVASDDTLLSENTNNNINNNTSRRRPSLPSFYSSHPQFTNNMLSKRHHHHHHLTSNNNMNTNSNSNNKGMMMDRFAALLYGNGMTNAMAAAAASAGLIDTCDLTLDHHSNELKTLARQQQQKQLQHGREASTTLKQNALQIEISTAGTMSSPNRRELEESSSSVTNSAVITSTNKNGILTKKRYDLLSVTLLPSSKVISGSSDGYIHIWDISSEKVNKPELKVRAHNGWVRCVASDPDGHYVVTGGGDKSIHLYALESDHLDGSWNDDDGDEIGDVSYVAPVREGLKQKGILEGHNGGITCVQADLSAVISGSVDREIKLWDIGTGKCVSTMVGHKSYVKTLQFYTYALASGGGCESEIKLWDIRSGRCVRRFFGHHRGVSALHFDEQRLVSGGRCDGMIKIFDLRMGALLDSLPLGPYQDQEPDYDMSRRNSLSSLSSRSSDLSGFSGLSGINSQRPRSTSYDIKEPMLNTNQTVTCLRFHHDKLIFGAKGLLGPVMYDMKTKSPVKQFLGHASHVNDLDFNRSCLVTASRDLTVKVWREEL